MNADGSSHVEEVVERRPPRSLVMRRSGFSPPLAGLAGHFVETWSLAPSAYGTVAARARGARHLREMDAEG